MSSVCEVFDALRLIVGSSLPKNCFQFAGEVVIRGGGAIVPPANARNEHTSVKCRNLSDYDFDYLVRCSPRASQRINLPQLLAIAAVVNLKSSVFVA